MALKRAKRYLLKIVGLALFAVVMWFIYDALDLEISKLASIPFTEYEPSPVLMFTALLSLLVGFLVNGFLWYLVISKVDAVETGTENHLDIKSALSIFFFSMLGKYLPGRVWHIASFTTLCSKLGVKSEIVLTGSAINQLMFLLGALILVSLFLPAWLGANGIMIIMLMLGAVVACLLLLPILEESSLKDWFEEKFSLSEKIKVRLAALYRGLNEVSFFDILLWVSIGVVTWLFQALAFAFLVKGIGIPGLDLSASSFSFLMGVMVAGYLGGYLVVVAPSGVGVREGVIALLLAQIMSPEEALLASVASFVLIIVADIILFAASSVVLKQKVLPKIKKLEEEGEGK